MKKLIKIKNRFTDKVIISGKYESIKDCLEKNLGANLSRAELSGANLSGAYLYEAELSGANLSGAYLSEANLSGAYLSEADLSGANLYEANLYEAYLYGADLSRAELSEADLSGAYLSRAALSGANLSGAKNYSGSHDFFQAIIKQQKLDNFTPAEWSKIGQIIVHRLCWDSIKKRYGTKINSVFKKLTKVGFDEFEKKYKELLK